MTIPSSTDYLAWVIPEEGPEEMLLEHRNLGNYKHFRYIVPLEMAYLAHDFFLKLVLVESLFLVFTFFLLITSYCYYDTFIVAMGWYLFL